MIKAFDVLSHEIREVSSLDNQKPVIVKAGEFFAKCLACKTRNHGRARFRGNEKTRIKVSFIALCGHCHCTIELKAKMKF